MNFLIDPLDRRSTFMFTDVMVYGWVGGKHACVNLIGGFTTCGIRGRGFYGRTCNPKVALSKVVKHDKACYDNQHAFIQFPFDTFDFLESEVVDILQSV